LITGGTGLLGSEVIRHWEAADGLIVEPGPQGARPDLRDPETILALVRRIRPDRVLHLAWVASRTPAYREDPTNAAWVEATTVLAEECVSLGIAFAGTGTVAETGRGTDAYSAAKAGLRERLTPLIDAGMITWLKPHYVFSIEARRPALVRAALAAIASGEPVHLDTPLEEHDFIEVSDVGRAVLNTLRGDLRGCVPIGSGRTHSALQFAEAMGAKVAPDSGAPATIGSTAAADIRRLLATGWVPSATREFFHER